MLFIILLPEDEQRLNPLCYNAASYYCLELLVAESEICYKISAFSICYQYLKYLYLQICIYLKELFIKYAFPQKTIIIPYFYV